jgi:MSHA biogenesis protein MshM
VGTGKTLLSRKLLASLDENVITAYIPNPYLTPEELKWFLAEEIGIPYSPSMPSYQLLREINNRLVALAQQKKQVVLVVDEAQSMPRETIEALRLLTNIETEKNKLLQVVLFGQPELDELLNRPDLRQLKQRIVFSEYLMALTRSGVNEYLMHRLASAGFVGGKLFSAAALNLLYRASGGIPRLINVIAHKAMMVAYAEQSSSVTLHHVSRAVLGTTESRSLGRFFAQPPYEWLLIAMSAATLAIVLPSVVG